MDREIIDLMFYQHCHDRKYHHDIYVMTRKNRLNHLVHHLHKYNNARIKPKYWMEDTLACLLSMAGTTNLHLDRAITDLTHTPTVNVNDIVGLFAEEMWEAKMDELLRALSKAMEALDHIENYDFIGTINNAIAELVIIIFQIHRKQYGGDNETLVGKYMCRLDEIKRKHCFHHYFDQELRVNGSCYISLRIKYLREAAVSHYIHADQTISITKIG